MAGVEIPSTQAKVLTVDYKGQNIKKTDWALACLATLAGLRKILNQEMLDAAISQRFKGKTLEIVRGLVGKVAAQN